MNVPTHFYMTVQPKKVQIKLKIHLTDKVELDNLTEMHIRKSTNFEARIQN